MCNRLAVRLAAAMVFAAAAALSPVAFANPDGTEAMILFNAGFNNQQYNVREKDRVLAETLPPRSVVTVVWAADGHGPVQVWMDHRGPNETACAPA